MHHLVGRDVVQSEADGLGGSPDAEVGEPPAREGELWTTVEVARYLKTSRSWVYQATASGSLPSIRVGHLRKS
jgi:excisionase family DNA binding protein